EVAVAVRHGDPVPVWIEAGLGGQDPARGVRDEDRMVVREQRPVRRHEVEQVWHLLEIGRDARRITQVMRVVELQVDDVLDRSCLAAELAARWIARRSPATTPV